MVNVKNFINYLVKKNINFFSGVPDSVLKSFINFLSSNKKKNIIHRITTNEGSAISLGIGYNLSQNKIPLIYFQNSGIGHAANPLYSLADKRIYSIPMILLIGRRGFPRKNDEPQHYRIGEITIKFLKLMNIQTIVLNEKNYKNQIDNAKKIAQRKSAPVALVAPMNFFQIYKNEKKINKKKLEIRYEYLKVILKNISKKDKIIASLGNVSRELFVLNEELNFGHSKTFYGIGAMGHANQIALEVSLNKKNDTTFILDGDGAVQMHMGNLITLGKNSKKNIIHILFNNKVHESTGLHPLANDEINYKMIFKACGYKKVFCVKKLVELNKILRKRPKGLIAIIIDVFPGSIKNLPRPTKKPYQLKKSLNL
tara:strand:+ start:274 stop:1380 length:1107 start_codon:yes stop_codon:yes gene_type:complete